VGNQICGQSHLRAVPFAVSSICGQFHLRKKSSLCGQHEQSGEKKRLKGISFAVKILAEVKLGSIAT
jgi:hypothetical protein